MGRVGDAFRVLLRGSLAEDSGVRPGWPTAGRGRRGAPSWRARSDSVNTLLAAEVPLLRNQSRDLVRGNAWAASALDSWEANIVGNGIVPIPQVEDEAFRREVRDAWAEWVDECDADGTSSFYGLQALIARAVRESGEVFVRYRTRRPEDGLSVPLQLQVLEAELCDSSKTELVGSGPGRILSGVEFDGIGRRVAYWMHRSHPGERATSLRFTGDTVRVPASEVVPVFQVLRPGQVRGVPGLAAALARLRDLDEYDDAEVVRKKVAAMFVAFVMKPDAESDPLAATAGTDDDDVPVAKLEPATVQELAPGEDVKFGQPSDVGDNYAAFMRQQLRSIAASIGITHEQMTLDLEGVNFSSIRAGLIEIRRRMTQFQNRVIVYQFCRPVYRRWLELAMLTGRLRVPRGFAAAPRDFMRVRWVATPGWEYVEPEAEVNAAIKAVRAGFVSREDQVARYGSDVEQLDEEIARDNARADELGLALDTDPRRTSGQGQGQTAGNAAAVAAGVEAAAPTPTDQDNGQPGRAIA